MIPAKPILDEAGHPVQVEREKAKAKARKKGPKARRDQEVNLLQERRMPLLVAFSSKVSAIKVKSVTSIMRLYADTASQANVAEV